MKKQYLFIDGYNLLFRMKEYDLIKSSTFPAERDMLIDILREYAGGNNYIVYCIFDAYLTRSKEYIKEEPPITIIYTKTGEKADQWIEKKTKELRIEHFIDIIVVSDDNDERDMALGYGAILRDCHRFIKELKERKQTVSKLTKNHNSRNLKNRHIRMSEETQKKLKKFLENGEF